MAGTVTWILTHLWLVGAWVVVVGCVIAICRAAGQADDHIEEEMAARRRRESMHVVPTDREDESWQWPKQ